MIRIAGPPPLDAATAYGLRVLVDLSRLLPVTDPAVDAVELQVHDVGDAAAPPVVAPGVVRIPRARLRWVADLAGAASEQQSHEADRHGRVPARANPLVAGGTERQPVVQQFAAALRDAVVAAAGARPVWTLAPWPHGHRWAVALTHDVDVVAGWPLFTALRLAELVRKGEGRRALRVGGAAVATAAADPVTAAFRQVVAIEQRLGAPATWFFICATPTLRSWRRGDSTYRPDAPRARRLLAEVREAGGEIGLHASFDTWHDAGLLVRQRERLARLAGTAVGGSRQHFLRLRPGPTQLALEAAGFTYDATFGFSDRNGYRLGVADVVPAWSEAEQRQLALDEVPLAWMDRALSKYAGVEDPAAWAEDALELAAAARDVEGLWVGLWHPNLAAPLGFPDAPEAYARLAGALAAERPWLATLEEITAWRRARRGLEAAGVAPDGTPQLRAAAPNRGTIVLERPGGAALELPWPAT